MWFGCMRALQVFVLKLRDIGTEIAMGKVLQISDEIGISTISNGIVMCCDSGVPSCLERTTQNLAEVNISVSILDVEESIITSVEILINNVQQALFVSGVRAKDNIMFASDILSSNSRRANHSRGGVNVIIIRPNNNKSSFQLILHYGRGGSRGS